METLPSYSYVGPQAIADRAKCAPLGTMIDSREALSHWIGKIIDEKQLIGEVIATFVIDERGELRLADRRSEHVACAGGMPVLAAGEIAFHVGGAEIEVAWVTNQSTGYCPEPKSWPAVAAALNRINIEVPTGFNPAFEFRWCRRCGVVNLLKDDLLRCEVCAEPLSKHWNFKNNQPQTPNMEMLSAKFMGKERKKAS